MAITARIARIETRNRRIDAPPPGRNLANPKSFVDPRQTHEFGAVPLSQAITVVDAFTDRPFGGNPAAVCILDRPAEDAWMQAVAREMNLSETAFLVREGDGFRLRWFTPGVEVDLCGHATLGSAHVLWEEGHLPAGEVARFFTRSGLLSAARVGDWIELDFPSKPVSPCDPPSGLLLEALGRPAEFVGQNGMDLFVVLKTGAEVRSLQPDILALATHPSAGGVIVTGPSDEARFDFVPLLPAGVAEDPVTGSAHCALGPYWAEKLGKQEMLAFQASGARGIVRVRPSAIA